MRSTASLLILAVLSFTLICLQGEATAKLDFNTMRVQCARACVTYPTLMDCATATYHDIPYCSWVGEMRNNACMQSCKLRDDITEAPESTSIELEFYPYSPSQTFVIRPTITAAPGISYPSVTSLLDGHTTTLVPTVLPNSDRCNFYTVNYHQSPLAIPYQAEFTFCVSTEEGPHCHYTIYDPAHFPPGTDVCPELPSSYQVSGGCENCLTEQTCTLTMPEVNADFGFVVRECGSDITIAQAGEHPIDPADAQLMQAAIAICEETVADELCGIVPECPVDQVCGNQVREVGEECDDGNTVSGDGCEDCQLEDFCIPGNRLDLPAQPDRPSREYICSANHEQHVHEQEECPGDTICLDGRCIEESTGNLHVWNGFDAQKRKTVIFVHGMGDGDPNLFRAYYESLKDTANIIYFKYDATNNYNEFSALQFNLALYDYMTAHPEQELFIITHSMAHLIVRHAVLMVRGVMQEGSGQFLLGEQLTPVYANTKIFSLSPILGGSQFAAGLCGTGLFSPPNCTRWSEFNPHGNYMKWLFNAQNTQTFDESVSGYHSYIVNDDNHLHDIWNNCPNRNQPGTPSGDSWCANYRRGISDDHVEYSSVAYTESVANGLKQIFGKADRNYCTNREISFNVERDANYEHVALLVHLATIVNINEIIRGS